MKQSNFFIFSLWIMCFVSGDFGLYHWFVSSGSSCYQQFWSHLWTQLWYWLIGGKKNSEWFFDFSCPLHSNFSAAVTGCDSSCAVLLRAVLRSAKKFMLSFDFSLSCSTWTVCIKKHSPLHCLNYCMSDAETPSTPIYTHTASTVSGSHNWLIHRKAISELQKILTCYFWL